MPLDPYFADRLATHRRYLVRTTLRSLGSTVRAAFRAIIMPSRRTSPATVTDPADRSAAQPRRPSLTPRQKHRKAALAWDTRELAAIGTPPPEITTTEHRVETSGVPPFTVRLYSPGRAAYRAEPDAAPGLRPVCLSFFGGAFRIGGISYPTTDAAFRRRADESGVVIAAVDYALAPEHRFPTQPEQAYAALEWISNHARELAIDPTRIAIAGTSAGANLAAAATLINRERGNIPLRFQLLEVPVTDLTGAHIDLAPTRAMRIPRLVVKRELRSVARTYLGDMSNATHHYASPLRAESLAGLPPAYILTAEYDPLRGDGAAYLAALRRSGVDASGTLYLGVTHDVAQFTGVLPAARRWHHDVVEILRTLHSPPGALEPTPRPDVVESQ